MAKSEPLPLGVLKYLYVGTAKFDDDLRYYTEVLGAEVIWNLSGFGARVAALRVAEGPLLLIADHRPAPSSLPIFAVADLDAVTTRLKERGWRAQSGPFEVPDGPCYLFTDASGNEMAILGNVRPNALSRARS